MQVTNAPSHARGRGKATTEAVKPLRWSDVSREHPEHTKEPDEERTMAEIINLNRARKARARAEAGKTAADNRVKFGRTKAEKTLARAEKALEEKRIDGQKLTPTSGEPE